MAGLRKLASILGLRVMKRTSLVFLCLVIGSCDRREDTRRNTNGAKAQATSSDSPHAAPATEVAAKDEVRRAGISPIAAELRSEQAPSGIPPSAPTVVIPSTSDRLKTDPPGQLHFTRVVGGVARYCGALSSGPIKCWGRDPKLVRGSFVDLALGEDGYCGVELGGRLSCEKLTPPAGVYTRVVAGGQNYCALGAQGAVSCFGPNGTEPQANQKATLIAAGAHFACVADPTERLLCWGKGAPLLPLDPVRVIDIAAGTNFVCFLRDGGQSKCLGKGPRLPEHLYAAISAGYETLCGITTDGAGYCTGRVEVQTSGPVRQFAVAESSVCAHRHDGKLECWGSEAEHQLKVPTETKGDTPASAAEQ